MFKEILQAESLWNQRVILRYIKTKKNQEINYASIDKRQYDCIFLALPNLIAIAKKKKTVCVQLLVV